MPFKDPYVDELARTVILKVMAEGTVVTTGDGKMSFIVPEEADGTDLYSVGAHVYTASTSGAITIQITNASAHPLRQDMLSTGITIDENETDSSTAATPAVINTAQDGVSEADQIRIDVDGAGTGAKGLEVRLGFRLP